MVPLALSLCLRCVGALRERRQAGGHQGARRGSNNSRGLRTGAKSGGRVLSRRAELDVQTGQLYDQRWGARGGRERHAAGEKEWRGGLAGARGAAVQFRKRPIQRKERGGIFEGVVCVCVWLGVGVRVSARVERRSRSPGVVVAVTALALCSRRRESGQSSGWDSSRCCNSNSSGSCRRRRRRRWWWRGSRSLNWRGSHRHYRLRGSDGRCWCRRGWGRGCFRNRCYWRRRWRRSLSDRRRRRR